MEIRRAAACLSWFPLLTPANHTRATFAATSGRLSSSSRRASSTSATSSLASAVENSRCDPGRLSSASVTSGSHRQATSTFFSVNSRRPNVKSSGENAVFLRTWAISSRVSRELVIMNSNTVWSGENIIIADLRSLMSSTACTSADATQASPPRDQSICTNARASAPAAR